MVLHAAGAFMEVVFGNVRDGVNRSQYTIPKYFACLFASALEPARSSQILISLPLPTSVPRPAFQDACGA